MGHFLTILILTVVAVLLAVSLMGIGWLLTGKVRIIKGACGMDPKKLRDKQCGTKDIHCDLCKPGKEDNEKNKS